MSIVRLLAAATAACSFLLAGCSATTPSIAVREVGSMYVGGRTVSLTGLPAKEIVFTPGAPPLKIDPNGDFEVEAMYARYTLLEHPKGKYPILLWHGGGLSGATFETTPDGRRGWESLFLVAGYDVYVSDAVERGRASWARYPEIFKSEPLFRTKKEAWELFRIGPTGSYAQAEAQRTTFVDSRFPRAAFDVFMKQSIPRWLTNDSITQAAYDAYVERVCPCVIVVHSQGGNFAFNSALRHPDKVKAIVAVETSGSPDPKSTDFDKLARIPMLWVWGDNLNGYSFWRDVRARQEQFRKGLRAAGGIADEIDLPEIGIHGNSHMLMMDRNSGEIAALIQQWLHKQGLDTRAGL